jgi:DNA invertase Pin-like site-specific DNA recombinase
MSLESDFRQVLAELELTSNGTTTAWNSSRATGKPGSKLLFLSEEPPHDHFRRRWDGCASDRARELVLAAAREALEGIRHQSQRPKLKQEPPSVRERRLVASGRGVPAKEIARRERALDREIIAMWVKHGLNPATGWPFFDEDRDAEIRRMSEARLSVREIAQALGVSKSAVHRALGRA